MVKVAVIKVFQPTIFLGTDLALLEKVTQACNQIRNSDSLLLPCTEITPQMVFLYDFKNQLIRLRIISAINPNTFRCYLIDYGRFEEIGKHRMFVIPTNQLQMDSAVKLFKITGLVPAGLNIANEGISIKAKLSESKEWIGASYKFVCKIFEENNLQIHVSYIKECSKDKAYVDVFANYNNKRENLKDLLIRERYAFAKEDHSSDLKSGLSNLSLVDDTTATSSASDRIAEDSADSLAGESVTKFLDDFKDDDEEHLSSIISKSVENSDLPIVKDNYDSLTTNRSTFGTLDEISLQILNNKVKSWLVNKSVEINSNDESVVKYEYKTPVRPILSYQKDQMIAAFLKDTMVHHKTKSLLLIQAIMIPSILRGVNVVAIAPPKKGKSMGMVMPILQKIATKPISRTRSFNPLAIILCTSWKKVKELSDSIKSFTAFINESNKIHKPRIVSAYAGQTERKIMIPILEGCDILIITPKCLLRLLKSHEFFKLNELEIMGLDDVENLIAHHLESLREIFIYKQTAVIETGKEVQQIVTASNWTAGLQSFIQNEMGNMFLLTVNNPLEIAVFERLKQKLIEYDKNPMDLYQKLLTYLEMTESTIKRTIIFASDDRQIRLIYKFLMEKVTFDLKLMVGSMSGAELRQVEREWNQYRGYVNMPVLLISDEALGRSDISIFNAHSIFHADVNPTMFGCRLNFLRDKFSELSFLQQPAIIANKETPSTITYHSFIFLSPQNLQLTHANFLYKFLGRCHSDRPTWLQEKAIDYVLNKEKSKVINEVCPQIKAKGECQFPACTKRHIVLSDVDKPLLPNRGKIKFRLLHLVSPSNFFVRILEHQITNEPKNSEYKSRYMSIKMAIIKHFSDSKNIQGASPKYIQPGFIAAIRLKDILERVLVLKIKSGSSTKIEVKLIDHGSRMIVEQSDLLTLPKELMEAPAQAVEIYVTGIRPLDNDEHYHEESCKFAKEFLEGKDLYGVIMLCIGKTLWVDSVTQLIHHKATNITVYDNNLSVELVEQDYVEKNPGHVQRLIRLCTGKIDIWNSASSSQSQSSSSQKAVPIMRKFTYAEEPLQFEELCVQSVDDLVDNECTVLKVVSPNLIFLSNRETSESIKQMQKEIKSLIDSIETLPLRDLKVSNRVLFCVDSDWLRGYILRVDDGGSALILSLDWGSLVTYSGDDYVLKKLPSEYQELPYHVILSSLCHCNKQQQYSEDVNSVIEDFVLLGGDNNSSSRRRVLLSVSALSVEPVDYSVLLQGDSDNVSVALQDLDIFSSLKIYSVSISKARDQEELLPLLVRKLAIIPDMSWIHTVLPESQPFISRLERSGSIPHLAADILSTRDADKRLKIAANIERLIVKNISFFECNEVVPSGSVDGMVNTLLVLIHFVSEQKVFMCLYRSLTALLNLANISKLPLDNIKSEEEFSILYISNIIYTYQSIIKHMLTHLSITINNNNNNNNNKCTMLKSSSSVTVDDDQVFLDMLRMLMINTSFVTIFLEESSWPCVMASCLWQLHGSERKYNQLLDLLVQLVMMMPVTPQPLLAGILKQCCLVVADSESPSVWHSSLALIGCLVNCKQYHSVLREADFFSVLFSKMMGYYGEVKVWTEVHEASLELLRSMWSGGSGCVDRRKVVSTASEGQGRLSEAVREVSKQLPGNEGLSRFLTDLVLEESSIVATVPGASAGDANSRGLPDADACEWMALKGNGVLLRKHRKCYKKIFENNGASDNEDNADNDNEGEERVESDSDSSDLEVTSFYDSRNPADEDNVFCYDRP